MGRIALILMWLAGVVQADGWQVLDEAGIHATLRGRVIEYDAAWQEFHAGGRTLYNAGHDSWGYWDVRSDRYCSRWPPADGWACYDVLRDGDRVRFVGESGHATDGRLRGE